MTSCIVCHERKGKLSCGCACQDATVHVHCLTSLAISAYERKSKLCPKCGAEFSCLKPHHYSKATAYKVSRRLQDSVVRFGRTGMTPRCYTRDGRDVSDSFKAKAQEVWEKAVDEEIRDCPEFAEKTLKAAKKHKVEFRYAGSRWD